MIQYVYVCKDELPMYVFMYLFLQYLHQDLWYADFWCRGKKNYGCHWNSYLPLFLRQYYVNFCCFKDFSTPEGVICKLSFFQVYNYDTCTVNIQKVYFITCAKCNDWFVIYVQFVHLFKDLVFQPYSHK